MRKQANAMRYDNRYSKRNLSLSVTFAESLRAFPGQRDCSARAAESRWTHGWRQWLVLCCLLLCPMLGFADDGSVQRWTILQIPSTDYSLYFLSLIFGTVGDVLNGPNKMLATLFKTLNDVVLALGGLVAFYVIIIGTLRSAQDGELLGRKWSTFFTPIRVAFGFLLMAPMPGGYSLIQIFFVWIATQGIAAADTMWNEAVDYFLQGGQVFVGATNNQPVFKLAGNVLDGLICTQTLKQQAQLNLAGNPQFQWFYHLPGSRLYKFPGTVTVTTPDGKQPVYAQRMPGVCGQISWSDAAAAGDNSIEAGLNQMILDLTPVAEELVKTGGVTAAINDLAVRQLIMAGHDYLQLTRSLQTVIGEQQAALDQQLGADMKKQGWIMAGSYFYHVYALSQTSIGLPSKYVPSWQTQKLDNNDSSGQYVNPFGSSPDVPGFVRNYTKAIQPAIQKAIIYQSQQHNPAGQTIQGVNLDAKADVDGATGAVFSIITLGMNQAVDSWKKYFGYTNDIENKTNPLTRIALFGSDCMQAAEQGWIIGGMIFFGLGMLGGLIPCLQAAVSIMMVWTIPIIAVLMTALLSMGFILGYFLPMMPFAIFIFAGLGWMISVIEAVCAAPLVAFGIAYPEGSNSIYGTAEPAIMLIIAVFLRPSLMIIGMFASMILSYVGVFMFNSGFSYAFNKMESSTGISIHGLFPSIGLMVVYTVIMVALIKKCFSLIDVIPDKVLTWVAGGRGYAPRFGDASSMYQEFESGLSGAAQQIAKGHTQGLTNMAKRYQRKYDDGEFSEDNFPGGKDNKDGSADGQDGGMGSKGKGSASTTGSKDSDDSGSAKSKTDDAKKDDDPLQQTKEKDPTSSSSSSRDDGDGAGGAGVSTATQSSQSADDGSASQSSRDEDEAASRRQSQDDGDA